MVRESDELLSNRNAIHSGHFMVSCLNDDENDDDESVASVDIRAIKGYNFKKATQLPRKSYQFLDKETATEVIGIDTDLSKLFRCLTLAYSGKITSPKWKTFKGLKLTIKDKVRLNNIIWREWHAQFVLKNKPKICQFEAPISDKTHTKPEAVVLEGKYWKRKLESVTAEYMKWRTYYKKIKASPEDSRLMKQVATHAELLERVGQRQRPGMFWLGQSTTANALTRSPPALCSDSLMDDDLMMMDFNDTLFSTLETTKFAFPSSRELSQLGNADIIQPGLIGLQPSLDDFMDTLEPLPSLQEMMNGGRNNYQTSMLVDPISDPFFNDSDFLSTVPPTSPLSSMLLHNSLAQQSPNANLNDTALEPRAASVNSVTFGLHSDGTNNVAQQPSLSYTQTQPGLSFGSSGRLSELLGTLNQQAFPGLQHQQQQQQQQQNQYEAAQQQLVFADRNNDTFGADTSSVQAAGSIPNNRSSTLELLLANLGSNQNIAAQQLIKLILDHGLSGNISSGIDNNQSQPVSFPSTNQNYRVLGNTAGNQSNKAASLESLFHSLTRGVSNSSSVVTAQARTPSNTKAQTSALSSNSAWNSSSTHMRNSGAQRPVGTFAFIAQQQQSTKGLAVAGDRKSSGASASTLGVLLRVATPIQPAKIKPSASSRSEPAIVQLTGAAAAAGRPHNQQQLQVNKLAPQLRPAAMQLNSNNQMQQILAQQLLQQPASQLPSQAFTQFNDSQSNGSSTAHQRHLSCGSADSQSGARMGRGRGRPRKEVSRRASTGSEPKDKLLQQQQQQSHPNLEFKVPENPARMYKTLAPKPSMEAQTNSQSSGTSLAVANVSKAVPSTFLAQLLQGQDSALIPNLQAIKAETAPGGHLPSSSLALVSRSFAAPPRSNMAATNSVAFPLTVQGHVSLGNAVTMGELLASPVNSMPDDPAGQFQVASPAGSNDSNSRSRHASSESVGSPSFLIANIKEEKSVGSPGHPASSLGGGGGASGGGRRKVELDPVAYKEHRRASHINAEQKRRFNIKYGFDTLCNLVPTLKNSPNAKTSKAAILQKAAEYARKLKSERIKMQEEADALRREVESLNASCGNCNSQLPATGVPVSGQRVSRMRTAFELYVRNRTLKNWKYWIFSVIVIGLQVSNPGSSGNLSSHSNTGGSSSQGGSGASGGSGGGGAGSSLSSMSRRESLFDSYCSSVSTASLEEFVRSVLAWLEQHCQLTHLRQSVLPSLTRLSTATSVLTDPSRVPQEATKAALQLGARHNNAGNIRLPSNEGTEID